MTDEASPQLALVRQRLESHGCRTTNGTDWTCPVPDHQDNNPSLSVNAGTKHPVVVHCHAGCDPREVFDAIGLTRGDVSSKPSLRREYEDVYTDEAGTRLYRVRRYRDVYGNKTFSQSAWRDGKWANGPGVMKGVRRVLLDLPALRRMIERTPGGGTVYLVEGEKSARALRDHLTTLPVRVRRRTAVTTVSQGAGKDFEPFAESLQGAGRVVIVADHDDTGREHAQRVAAVLGRHGIPRRVVQSATDGPKDDIVEHLAAGFGLADLRRVPTVATAAADGTSWRPTPLGLGKPNAAQSAPTLFARDDGLCLLYPGKVHSIHGESESGKSWVAQAAVAQAVQAGGRALYVDFESDYDLVDERLALMGLTPDERARIDYATPDAPNNADAEQADWARVLRNTYAVAVVDGVTDGMNLFGLSINDNDHVSQFHQAVPRPLARKTSAAVIVVDHVVKSTENRNRFAIGGQHKMAAVDGAAFTVDVVHPLGRGLRGEVNLKVGKDRPGHLRGHAATSGSDRTQHIAAFTLDATGDGLTWSLTAEKAKLLRTVRTNGPTDDERVLAWLQEQPQGDWFSTNTIRQGVKGLDQKKVPAALQALLDSARVEMEARPGRGGGQQWRASIRNLGEGG